MDMVRPSLGPTTQPFGNVIDGVPHAGEDYAYTAGGVTFPDVYAAAGGVVVFAGDSRTLAWPNIMYLNTDFDRTDNVDSSAGNYVIIRHPGGELTGYAHLEQWDVTPGQVVAAGERIGTVGQTGNSRGKHLHFDYVPDPSTVSVAPYYGRADPAPHYTTSIAYSGAIQENEDDIMPRTREERAELVQIAAEGFDQWSQERRFPGNRNFQDVILQFRSDIYSAAASKVNPTLDIDALAKAIAEELDENEIKDLASKLVIVAKP